MLFLLNLFEINEKKILRGIFIKKIVLSMTIQNANIDVA